MPRQLLLQWWKYAHVHKKVRGIIQMRPRSPHFSTKISCARARFAIKVLYHPLLPRAAECHILRMSHNLLPDGSAHLRIAFIASGLPKGASDAPQFPPMIVVTPCKINDSSPGYLNMVK